MATRKTKIVIENASENDGKAIILVNFGKTDDLGKYKLLFAQTILALKNKLQQFGYEHMSHVMNPNRNIVIHFYLLHTNYGRLWLC